MYPIKSEVLIVNVKKAHIYKLWYFSINKGDYAVHTCNIYIHLYQNAYICKYIRMYLYIYTYVYALKYIRVRNSCTRLTEKYPNSLQSWKSRNFMILFNASSV